MTTYANEVAIIDDDQTTRGGLARLVESIGLTAHAYGSAEEFLENHPGEAACVVTDMRMPGMSGLQLQEELTNRALNIPLIVLTGYADVPAAVRSMKAGAFDFIEKPCSPQILLETIHQAMRKCEQLRKEKEEATQIRARFETLTTRERQVMRLVVAGNANKVIARHLKVSEKTVEFHRANVMNKMKADSMAELVKQSMHCPQPSPADLLPNGAPVMRELGNDLA